MQSSYLIAFGVIVLLECILSVDNAAVIGVIANNPKLTRQQQVNVTKYGILGAYILRAASMFAVGWFLENPSITAFIKLAGGAYLVYLGYKGLTPEHDSPEEGNVGWLDKLLSSLGVSAFVATIIEVEWLDLVFSIDNIFACVAFTENIKEPVTILGYETTLGLVISITAVLVGITMMRFVIKWFQKLLVKYPELNACAMIVIILLGAKLLVSAVFTFAFVPYHHEVNTVLENHYFDFAFSAVMMLIFFMPILKGMLRRTSVA